MDWQKHIRNTHADYAGFAICGKKLEPFDWAFTDVDHAFQAIPKTWVQPCPACAQKVLDTFSAPVKE